MYYVLSTLSYKLLLLLLSIIILFLFSFLSCFLFLLSSMTDLIGGKFRSVEIEISRYNHLNFEMINLQCYVQALFHSK